MTNIGIIGAGIAGLHLGLFLRQHDIAATIYTEKTPEQQLGGRLCNIVVRFGVTRERERQLGVNHWDSDAPDLTRFSVSVGGHRPLAFSGELSPSANIVDMRIYCARLLEDFAMRGGRVVIGALQTQDVERLAAEHDLMVVAAGRGSLANMFPRLPSTRLTAGRNGWPSEGSIAGSPTRSRPASTLPSRLATVRSSRFHCSRLSRASPVSRSRSLRAEGLKYYDTCATRMTQGASTQRCSTC
jgi:hypothetical protein